jgi:magnesium-transporting ATPase (P-type)
MTAGASRIGTRSDSPTVVRALLDSAHAVLMLTGDAPLTALHVAKEVGICSASRPQLLLASAEGGVGSGAASEMRWVHGGHFHVGRRALLHMAWHVSGSRRWPQRW